MKRERIGIRAHVFLLTMMACMLAATSLMAGGDSQSSANAARAIFAGGCFWCSESDFEKVDGVVSVVSGYTGGESPSPTYYQVSAGSTGHAEAVQVDYDPSRVSYEELLQVFWHSIDPTVKDRQFCDVGSQYRSGIFYLDKEQQAAAESSKMKLIESGVIEGSIETEITSATRFYPAEEEHQDYYKKNSAHYKRYRKGCGRDQRLEQLWGDTK